MCCFCWTLANAFKMCSGLHVYLNDFPSEKCVPKSGYLLNASRYWERKWKWKSLSHVRLFLTPWRIHSRILEWVAFPISRGIFPMQGSNPSLPHCRQILYQLSVKGSPGIGKMHSIASRFLNPFFPGTLPGIEISFLYWALSMLLDTCARFGTHIAPVLITPWRWVIWCLLTDKRSRSARWLPWQVTRRPGLWT